MTVTIAVPLDDDHAEAVRSVRERWGLAEATAPPHLTIVVLLESPSPGVVDELVADVARRHEPLVTTARGVGLFLNKGEDEAVLHVPVVRTPRLSRLHARVFDAVVDAGAVVEGHHRPDSWFPHLTLGHCSADPEHVAALFATIAAGPPIAWHLPLGSVARFAVDGGGGPPVGFAL